MRNLASRPSPVLFACLFASQAALLVLSPVLPDIAREFGTSTAAAGQLRTVLGAAGGLTAVSLALAGRRPGLRAMLMHGANLVLAGAVTSALAPSFAVLAFAQAVIGVGIGVIVSIGIAAAGEWAAPADRAKTLAWAIAGMPAAWVVGMPLAGVAAAAGWRVAWLVVAGGAAAIALALVRLRPPDPTTTRRAGATAAWRRPEVARFTLAELLANAAWASVLTYSGALLIETYGASRETVALGLGAMAAAMVPGTFVGRRVAPGATLAQLVTLTISQACAVAVLGIVHPATSITLVVLAVMAFTNGWRSVLASSLGMDTASDDKVAVMSLRASANQFGYLVGAAAGALALPLGGFAALGVVLAGLFAFGALLHVTPAPQPACGSMAR